MQSKKSPLGESSACPVYLTCKIPGYLAQAHRRDSEINHKHHVRSDTLYPHLLPSKKDMRMKSCLSCKEPPVNIDQKPKQQSS